MPNVLSVDLQVATPSDATLLANLLELYIHDRSAAFPDIAMGADGRFGYATLPRYWSEPDRRSAFLIRCRDQIAGFALVVREAPTPDMPEVPEVLDVAEFFVLRRYRRTGVGRRAAHLLWRRFRGRWQVRVSQRNPGGLAFWRDVVASFAHDAVTESRHADAPNAWRIFSFESRGE